MPEILYLQSHLLQPFLNFCKSFHQHIIYLLPCRSSLLVIDCLRACHCRHTKSKLECENNLKDGAICYRCVLNSFKELTTIMHQKNEMELNVCGTPLMPISERWWFVGSIFSQREGVQKLACAFYFYWSNVKSEKLAFRPHFLFSLFHCDLSGL